MATATALWKQDSSNFLDSCRITNIVASAFRHMAHFSRPSLTASELHRLVLLSAVAPTEARPFVLFLTGGATAGRHCVATEQGVPLPIFTSSSSERNIDLIARWKSTRVEPSSLYRKLLYRVHPHLLSSCSPAKPTSIFPTVLSTLSILPCIL
ncbi:hypothetical protein EJ02DRAFT_224145 [Clathrospora elynae]|uniref:Uncharacterized protein n=1 Tax=Clathrospora elynae TaxID=706981 RepID=A0A6A5SKF5_9PLEO|nr:hypothetical protein EJ02DRAFT_224145 [Clathrospora elynae]